MSALPPEEMVGNIAAETVAKLHGRLKHQRALLDALLANVGEPARCRGCAAMIMWVRHRVTHRNTPYDLDGTNHFATCPKANEFRKPKETAIHE